MKTSEPNQPLENDAVPVGKEAEFVDFVQNQVVFDSPTTPSEDAEAERDFEQDDEDE